MEAITECKSNEDVLKCFREILRLAELIESYLEESDPDGTLDVASHYAGQIRLEAEWAIENELKNNQNK